MNDPLLLPAFSAYGIELEYMIVDQDHLGIMTIADLLCPDPEPENPIGCSNEIVLHLVELKNHVPSADLPALLDAFRCRIASLNHTLHAAHARLMPGAMHPWMQPATETLLWPHQQAEIYRAYDRIFDCRRHGHANVQSMQINLPFADDAEFARLHQAVRLALPIIPALAASSPYADGRWSGWMDYRLETYRTHQSRVASSMGELIPEPVASRAEYETRILAPMYREIAGFDSGRVLQHEWLNVRAAVPRFERNAIEIRIPDVQECPQADLAIAAAVIALVRHLYDEAEDAEPLATRELLSILQGSMRDAERAIIDHAGYLRRLQYPGQRCSAGELWAHLLGLLQRERAELALWLPTLQFILEHGPLARRLFERVGAQPRREDLREAYAALSRCLALGELFRGEA